MWILYHAIENKFFILILDNYLTLKYCIHVHLLITLSEVTIKPLKTLKCHT